MNTHKPTNHVGAQREPFYRRDDLIVRGASSNASYTAKLAAPGPPGERTDFGNGNRSIRKGNQMDTEPWGELVTVQAAADRLAVSRWMVYQLIWDERVKSVHIGRCRRIVRQSLDDYLSGLIEGAA